MSNSRKKFAISRVVRKFFLNETKNHNPPPFKLNGRSLTFHTMSDNVSETIPKCAYYFTLFVN